MERYKKIDGGIFYNQTSHHLDLLINLFGPLVKVSSFLSKNRKNIEVEDTAVVSLLFKSGLVGSINVSMLNHSGNYETSLTVVGDKGTLKIGGENLNIIEYWSFKNNSSNKITLTKIDQNYFLKPEKGHEIYYKNVYLSFKNIKNDAATGFETLETMKLISNIYKTSKNNLLKK